MKVIPDVQADAGRTSFRIESVGVTGLRYPLAARDGPTGEDQRTTADWRMGVPLAADRRGTHMSRFVAALHESAGAGQPWDLDRHLAFTQELTTRLDAPAATVDASFAWFREVRAPITGLAALLECHVVFKAETGAKTASGSAKTLTVTVPAKSLCPCSKAISERGAHNQRSDITVSVTYDGPSPVVAINRLMELVEQSASSPVYPLLKREDEKFVTEAAYDNPVFAEDIVRNAAQKLIDLPGVVRFTVEALNRESIHAHDCYARVVFER